VRERERVQYRDKWEEETLTPSQVTKRKTTSPTCLMPNEIDDVEESTQSDSDKSRNAEITSGMICRMWSNCNKPFGTDSVCQTLRKSS
jgi:hypothetical protein